MEQRRSRVVNNALTNVAHDESVMSRENTPMVIASRENKKMRSISQPYAQTSNENSDLKN